MTVKELLEVKATQTPILFKKQSEFCYDYMLHTEDLENSVLEIDCLQQQLYIIISDKKEA